MGSLLGALLARSAQADVTVCGTWRQATFQIRENGIRIEEESSNWRVAVEATALAQAPAGADLVLVLVKSYRTEAIAGIAAGSARPSGLILTLQNGLGNVEILSRESRPESVAAGVTAMGATLMGPGRVRLAGVGPTVLGAGDCRLADVRSAAALLASSGLEVSVVDNLDRHVWSKLAVNCAINPLTAVLDVPNGALLERPEPRTTMERVAAEVGDVARAMGMSLEPPPEVSVALVAERTSDNISSMLQDVRRGAPTEIDFINGAVVREGLSRGVPTPLNGSLWRQVRALEGRPIAEEPAELDTRGAIRR